MGHYSSTHYGNRANRIPPGPSVPVGGTFTPSFFSPLVATPATATPISVAGGPVQVATAGGWFTPFMATPITATPVFATPIGPNGGTYPSANYIQQVVAGANPSLPTYTDDRMTTFLLSAQAQLIGKGVYPNASQVMISVDEEPFPLTGSDFLLITPSDFARRRSETKSMGRYQTTMVGRTRFRVFKKLPADAMTMDQNRLTNFGYGMYPTLERVHDALQDFLCAAPAVQPQPVGRQILKEPLDLETISRPRKYPKDPSYVTVEAVYETVIAWSSRPSDAV